IYQTITVNTHNASLDVFVDLNVRNWVTHHVNNVFTSINEKLVLMANSMRDMMLKLDYLATDVNRLKGGEEDIVKRFGPLNEDPMAELKNLRPTIFVDAFSLANLQEATLVVTQRNTPILQTPRANNGFYANKNVVYPTKSTTTTLALPAPNTQTVTKQQQLSQKEFDKKRAKNLCFYYDQKYMAGHKCSDQMYALEISPWKEIMS
ncbi:hypothetical protein Tco_1355739, partial [Tanacetum coccineum]